VVVADRVASDLVVPDRVVSDRVVSDRDTTGADCEPDASGPALDGAGDFKPIKAASPMTARSPFTESGSIRRCISRPVRRALTRVARFSGSVTGSTPTFDAQRESS
jgi:hypothetical protein